jgi:hypothetical protein
MAAKAAVEIEARAEAVADALRILERLEARREEFALPRGEAGQWLAGRGRIAAKTGIARGELSRGLYSNSDVTPSDASTKRFMKAVHRQRMCQSHRPPRIRTSTSTSREKRACPSVEERTRAVTSLTRPR